MQLGDGDAAARYAVIQFGDDANPLPADLCSDIALAPYIGVVGIAIRGAQAGGERPDNMIGSVTDSRHWSVRGANATSTPINLDFLASAQVDAACGNGNRHVAIIIR